MFIGPLDSLFAALIGISLWNESAVYIRQANVILTPVTCNFLPA
jgi:hypothetical protein